MSQDRKSNGRVAGQSRNPPNKPLPKFGPPRAPGTGKNRGRRGGRGRRGRRRPKSNQQSSMWQTGGTSPQARLTMPAAMVTTNPSQFFRKEGAVKHKEWGEGSRFIGRSIFGLASYGANSPICFAPYLTQYFTIDGVSVTTNPYNIAVDESSNASTPAGIVHNLHPNNITRLNFEVPSWGRYCFRELGFTYYAISPTASNNSYVACVGHDVSLPLTRTWMAPDTGLTSGKTNMNNILNVSQSVNGTAYQGFEMNTLSYDGTRTWPTSSPVYAAVVLVDDMVELGTETEVYNQYFFAMRPSTNTSQSFSYAGAIMVDYVIDFYSPRYVVDNHLDEGQRPLQSKVQKNFPSRKERKIPSTEKADFKVPLSDPLTTDRLPDKKDPESEEVFKLKPPRSLSRPKVRRQSLAEDYVKAKLPSAESCPCCDEYPCKRDRRFALDD